MKALIARYLTPHDWHGEWNYTITPNQHAELSVLFISRPLRSLCASKDRNAAGSSPFASHELPRVGGRLAVNVPAWLAGVVVRW